MNRQAGAYAVGDRLFFKLRDGSSVSCNCIRGETARDIAEMCSPGAVEGELTRQSLGRVLMTLDALLVRAVSLEPGQAAEVAAEMKAIALVTSRAQLLLAMVEARADPQFRR